MSNRDKKRQRKQQQQQQPANSQQWSNQTPFRILERTFKRRQTLLKDLQPLLLDLDLESPSTSFKTVELSPPLILSEPQLDVPGTTRVIELTDIPGLFILKRAIPPSLQRQLVQECLEKHCKVPNLSNLDAHYLIPNIGIWKVYQQSKRLNHAELIHPRSIENTETMESTTADGAMKIDPPTDAMTAPKSMSVDAVIHRLRWVTLGHQYDWTRKQYHFDRLHAFPDTIATITHQILAFTQELTGYSSSQWRPEAGVINWYHPGDTLMGHQDRSEVDMTAPLVSLSVGLSCVFLISPCESKDITPTAIRLDSGDVLIMSKSARRVFHGVPLVIPDTCPDYLMHGTDSEWNAFAEWMDHSRLNINVRQVFPTI
ncbi:hypothetical protein BATDEDRAFT_92196 [Batrachochytrium dendrobatidis JAM81]|uniref:Fe2OG dioxygenase domain-containing protein n=2 Tax=Batrachochytrium dendrobatidis TaxID=109871 RepID=F4PD52_BATDJ|nr:uncharacterized protein BATDEDRAFT_92196 [Batrachochytrium dendrobatidis JAM81]EGF76915.1 hypothetical protein BATDEDRAFT_92196 [Batrachochytrium dendrobatidis JAM81]KAJ8330837.1 hypothetical protein O5D80_000862 [Batrachochytrium dendrobatidis]KAK5672584.1 hypothetical protein QVD99_001339 [Batrachochytrium dendrobatidis]OAJ45117.1 alkylated DNA repair protein AlkB [Batrachochytrium dendrobatidis JEL423]|eukprot:XP_006682502.1 hypothetical protein BATDEDRAFT_92196 [Batrachochytrium dendrobatidis JAM81]